MEKDEKAEALQSLLGGNPADFCARWKEALDQSSEDEREWRCNQAETAVKVYEGSGDTSATSFNIFHSNIETLVPALYNSSPIPDVRRRFNDDDNVASAVAMIIERAIGFSIDDYDFDETMLNVVKDMAVVDRGIARVKYNPTFGNDDATVLYEEALCEYVPWKLFRRGPATTWAKVPWIAFIHFLDRKETEKLVTAKENILGYDEDTQASIFSQLHYAYTPDSSGDKSKDKSESKTFARREMVWEVWDKETGQVVWLSQDYGDHPLAIHDDPLRLKGFFPTPRPAMIIRSTDKLTPITSFSIYSKLVEQLNDISERIDAMVDQIRVRGAYAGVFDQIEQIGKAEDGQLLALDNAELFATTGGDLSKAIVWWPLEMIYKALEVLVGQREVVKQTIYEVTGLSDIIRGASDAAETATAQQIKQQWGSVRIQSHQKEVERYARDLFRLKSEVMCKHFSVDTLLAITGLKYPNREEMERAESLKQMGEQALAEYQQTVQAAQAAGQQPPPPPIPEEEFKKMQEQVEEILGKPLIEDIEAMMRDDRVMRYKVDIESDSTVRADLTKNQEQMKGFLDGTAAYAGAVGPMVQEGIMPGDVAVKIYSAFTRNFRLGKSAEDALDEWAEKVKKDGVQGKPPDPTVQAEADLKVAQAEKTRTEAQLLPEQHNLEKAKARSDVMLKVRQAESADVQAANQFELEKRSRTADIQGREREHGLKERELEDRDRQFTAGLDAQRDEGERSERLERMKLSDARSARAEGYAVSAQTQPTEFDPEGKPIERPPFQPPELGELEEVMTREERERLERSDQMLATVAEGQQQMAQSLEMLAQAQAQQAEALTQAIQALSQAITAPKKVIRDDSGKAVGVEPVV